MARVLGPGPAAGLPPDCPGTKIAPLLPGMLGCCRCCVCRRQWSKRTPAGKASAARRWPSQRSMDPWP